VSTATPTARSAAPVATATGASRPAWWVQAAVIGVGLWLYDRINDLSPIRAAAAQAHARAVLDLQAVLHLEPELPLNRWLSAHRSLGFVSGSYYDMAHLGVTFALLAWVFLRHHGPYRFLRNALVGTNAIGFLVFWAWPLAPPRLVSGAGFTDVVVLTNAIGMNTSGTGSPHANEYAAMPSLHLAYACWCVLAVWSLSRSWVSRSLVAAHLALTTTVVLATGNHYTLDVVAGVATTAVAAGGALLVERALDRRRLRTG
jgi:hypothetical protein